jgi:hypothetical protein
MNVTLFRALISLLPAGMLLCGSMLLFFRKRAVSALFQVIGAGALVMVVLTHIAEALDLFRLMQWGAENSAGHYLDLCGAVIGLTLFPVGYLLSALSGRHAIS